jgi:NAD(P)-dependent dehydrogenase (short-subunit alcohol dehydrogenase family)
MNIRKKVVVTGASSGIGRATVERFAAEGWDVCLLARRKERLVEIHATLPAGHHLLCIGDYSTEKNERELTELLRKEWGHVDALVNSAGVSMQTDPINDSWESWKANFDIMIVGAARMTRVVVPLMKTGGRIIHVTSIHKERAEKGASAYSSAKAAIDQYCRALAVELAPKGILVNSIAPGFVDTEMSTKADGTSELVSEWFRENYVEGNHLPLRRAAQPSEISGVAFFLAGPDATYITGQAITVDGGLTITF